MVQSGCNGMPQEFEVFVGGCFGPTFTVRLKGRRLLYEKSPGVYSLTTPVEIKMIPGQWDRFWRELDRIGIWEWASEYENAAADGTHWRVHIVTGARSITSEGSNSYPNEDATGVSVDFERFLSALRDLLGGVEFR